jgi:CheY-like chemotaxis protein
MKHILIVDDIEENLELLRIILEGHGYEVEQAGHDYIGYSYAGYGRFHPL